MLGYSLEMFFTAAAFINMPGSDEAAIEGYRIFTEEVHDLWGLSMSYQNMARIAARKDDEAEKDRYLALFKELVQLAPLSIQAGLFYLGTGLNERLLGHFEKAKNHFEEGLKIFQQIRSINFALVMKSELAHIARQTGQLSDAKVKYHETLQSWQNMGHRGAIANQLECLAFIAILEEEPHRAATLLGAAQSLRERVQSPMTDYEQVEYDKHLQQLRSMLPEVERRPLLEEGRTMPLAHAILLALDL